MKYFPEWILKRRYINKGLRISNNIYRNIVKMRVPRSKFQLEKVGSNYGGWYVPVKEIQSDWIIYSAGIGLDMTFDHGMVAKYGCQLFAFDPTPQSIAFVNRKQSEESVLEKLCFSPIGLWGSNATLRFYAPRTRGWAGSYSIHNLQGTEDYFDAECKSIATVMNDLGHHKIHLLKIDIEGAEYEVLDDLVKSHIEVDWLCVEFDQPVPFWTTEAMLERLRKAGFVLQMADKWNLTFAHQRVL